MPLTSAQKDNLEQLLKEAVEGQLVPAVSFAVTDTEGVLYSRNLGNTVFDDPASKAVDDDSLFFYCSQSKLITSIAILQLIEQGKLSLSTPASQYIPELANTVIATEYDPVTRKPTASKPNSTPITVGHLLNHSSGLDYQMFLTYLTGPRAYLCDLYYHDYSKEEAGKEIEAFCRNVKGDMPGIPLKFEPGTDFAYSFGTNFVGFIVERVTGKSLEVYLKEHIFNPLGITSISFYVDTPERKARLLPMTFRDLATGKLEAWSFPPLIDTDSITLCLGGVGLYGTQHDYLTLLRHLLQIHAGKASNPILSKSSVESLLSPSLPDSALVAMGGMAQMMQSELNVPQGKAQFSLGMLVNTVDIPGHRRAGSGCWFGWANTMYMVDPTSGIAMVFGTQLVSIVDAEFQKASERLEKAVYQLLVET
ncbi:Acyltransferase mlcH [Mycena indigotica]|uniref:Acyltransferase mlcH n=1 Tax=Mycena indigotica TaxID=2126181 RepID=A0A8H6TGD2_9AGAR|nr:Acyltransferase mlcH [Mycena indigotica]KAF7316252.1 Acyltransferase mlcH [Mycena indigotica]